MRAVRKLVGLLAVAVCGVGLSGTAVGAEQIVVAHYDSQLFGAPYAIAMAKGYFQEGGLKELKVLGSSGGGTSVRNMLASGAFFAEVALPSAIAAIAQGHDLKIVSPGVDGLDAFWVTRAGMKIETPEDLKGKRIAYTRPQSVSEGIIHTFLEQNGLSSADVKLVAIGGIGAGITALQQDKVDLAILPEPVFSDLMRGGAPYKVVGWLNDKLPKITQTVGVATIETITNSPDKLRAAIAARRKGVDFLYANPGEAAAITSKLYGLPPAVMEGAIGNLRKLSSTWWNPGRFDRKAMSDMVQVLHRAGAIEKDVDWSQVIDDRFIPDDLR